VARLRVCDAVYGRLDGRKRGVFNLQHWTKEECRSFKIQAF
jgi:hypothetical protein